MFDWLYVISRFLARWFPPKPTGGDLIREAVEEAEAEEKARLRVEAGRSR